MTRCIPLSAGPMLSVLIETRNHEEGLARTLASLVPGAVEGLVREVVVCDLGSADQTRRVADHAGCVFLAQGGLAQGVRQARGDWLLVLPPGARLLEGWMEPLTDHVQAQRGPGRLKALGGKGVLAGLLSGRSRLGGGILVTRAQALSLVEPGGDAEALARRLAPRRLAATATLPSG